MPLSTAKLPDPACCKSVLRKQASSSCKAPTSPRERRHISRATASTEELQPEQKLKPAYNKYRSPGELSRYAIQQWKELSAQDVSLPPLTAWSKLVFALSWVKYTVVPEPIRYVCFCIWACLCTAWAPFHKRLTLQGAKLDVYLLHRAYPDAQVTVPQAVILKRFHHNMSIVETAAYRLGLLKAILITSVNKMRQRNLKDAEDPVLTPPPAL